MAREQRTAGGDVLSLREYHESHHACRLIWCGYQDITLGLRLAASSSTTVRISYIITSMTTTLKQIMVSTQAWRTSHSRPRTVCLTLSCSCQWRPSEPIDAAQPVPLLQDTALGAALSMGFLVRSYYLLKRNATYASAASLSRRSRAVWMKRAVVESNLPLYVLLNWLSNDFDSRCTYGRNPRQAAARPAPAFQLRVQSSLPSSATSRFLLP